MQASKIGYSSDARSQRGGPITQGSPGGASRRARQDTSSGKQPQQAPTRPSFRYHPYSSSYLGSSSNHPSRWAPSTSASSSPNAQGDFLSERIGLLSIAPSRPTQAPPGYYQAPDSSASSPKPPSPPASSSHNDQSDSLSEHISLLNIAPSRPAPAPPSNHQASGSSVPSPKASPPAASSREAPGEYLNLSEYLGDFFKYL